MKPSEDADHFRKWLDEGVILRDGEGSVEISEDRFSGHDPVWVAIVVNVQGYGPHEGAIYADQNRYHASADTALQEAYEILENYERDNMSKEDWKRLEKDAEENNMDASELMTETYDAVIWKLDPKEFAKALKGSKAAKFISVHDSKD
jgi:hypothetical protein